MASGPIKVISGYENDQHLNYPTAPANLNVTSFQPARTNNHLPTEHTASVSYLTNDFHSVCDIALLLYIDIAAFTDRRILTRPLLQYDIVASDDIKSGKRLRVEDKERKVKI